MRQTEMMAEEMAVLRAAIQTVKVQWQPDRLAQQRLHQARPSVLAAPAFTLTSWLGALRPGQPLAQPTGCCQQQANPRGESDPGIQ